MKFFREKNAKSIQDCIKITPKTHKLGDFLVKKLIEKANHIETIFDDNLRYEYLKNKNKLEKAKNLTKKEIKTFLAKRLSVDLLQLYNDMAKYYFVTKIKTQSILDNTALNLKELEYKKSLLSLSEEIKNSDNKDAIFNNFYNLILGYMSLFDLNFEIIEKERLNVEEKEGNFYNGIIVIYKN
ncbi:MAG: hypothetical protein IJX17_08715 [Clostridia bacterium]|nr:hypothetical protein [Clostridia bacterium]